MGAIPKGHEGSYAMKTFTYNLHTLEKLRGWLHANGNKISKALPGFLEEIGSDAWIQYLEFAEEIVNDRDFPEKHFTRTECFCSSE